MRGYSSRSGLALQTPPIMTPHLFRLHAAVSYRSKPARSHTLGVLLVPPCQTYLASLSRIKRYKHRVIVIKSPLINSTSTSTTQVPMLRYMTCTDVHVTIVEPPEKARRPVLFNSRLSFSLEG